MTDPKADPTTPAPAPAAAAPETEAQKATRTVADELVDLKSALALEQEKNANLAAALRTAFLNALVTEKIESDKIATMNEETARLRRRISTLLEDRIAFSAPIPPRKKPEPPASLTLPDGGK